LLTSAGVPYLPFALDAIDLLRPLGHVCYALAEFADGARAGSHPARKLHVRLLNEQGACLVKLTNLYVRQFSDAPLAFPGKRNDMLPA
jgi:polyketide synthase PksL